MSENRESALRRLEDALRLAAFLKVPESRLAAPWLEILAAALIALAIPTLYALVMVGMEGTWDLHTGPGTLFFIPVLMLAAVVIARIVRRNESVPALLFASLLAWIAIDILSLTAWAVVSTTLGAHRWVEYAFFHGALVWLALAIARYAVSLERVGGGRQIAVMLASLAFVAAPLGYFQPERSWWVKDWSRQDDTAGAERWAAANEEAFYRQPVLLERELAAVKKGRPGVVDIFFIGMAGYGSQDVFMREVESVTRLMRDRFDAEGRSIRLINNPKTVHSSPIASLTGLEQALARVASRMDIQEDVLVLFLTSHGSADHKFSLDLYPLRFRQLDPTTLRRALDESGIRNRIIIVSACYAGGFANALKNDYTLVIAAAAPDRNSFGCTNEAQWTYFGKAYFDEALRKTFSFTRAFEMATPVIEKREKGEGHEPSKPVMVVGEKIRPVLLRLEHQLTGVAAPRNAPRHAKLLADNRDPEPASR